MIAFLIALLLQLGIISDAADYNPAEHEVPAGHAAIVDDIYDL